MNEIDKDPLFGTPYEGVIDHAKEVGLLAGSIEVQGERHLSQLLGVLLLLRDEMPDSGEIEALRLHARAAEHATEMQVRYVDQGRFKPADGFTIDFKYATQELLNMYRGPDFLFHTKQARSNAAARILEKTDTDYAKFYNVGYALKMKDLLVAEAGEDGYEARLDNFIENLQEVAPE